VRCIGNPPTPTSRNSRSRGCISLEGRPNLLGRLNGTILIYGATGYTGKLIAKAAADAGARPILAGCTLAKVNTVAGPLGLKARAFDLGDPTRLDAAIKDVSVVLCVAGPFSATSLPKVDACQRNRVNYLDITGEIDVFEALAARAAEAQSTEPEDALQMSEQHLDLLSFAT
jgi:short subunit dehydrogenase-like uncharacterized protein